MLAIPPFGASSNIALWRANNKPPLEVVVANLDEKKAEGILLENGDKIEADYVICACDTDYTFRELLPEKYIPEGLKKMQEVHPDVEIYCTSIDEKLNENGYIVPGLGDAGDRIFGTK